MKVSIVTVVKNAEFFIDTCLQSVVNQCYDDVEYIVIDGNSSDRTLEVISFYSENIKILVSEQDSGMYNALNKGIRMATGEVIGILNADDCFATSKLISLIVDCFVKHRCDAVYGNLNIVQRYSPEHIVRKWRSKSYTLSDFKWGWMPAHPTFYVRRHIFEQFGGYKPEFRVSADYELMLRFLFKHRIHAVFLNYLFVNMRSGGMSNGSFSKQLHNLIHDWRALKENRIPYPFIALLAKRIRKIRQYLS